MRRKLAEMIVDVEAAQALVFDGGIEPNRRREPSSPRLRLGAPLTKLQAARLGITMASDAIEIHGGNGYIETWPVARILRDAQVNTLWEGPDNILCLDVRRGIDREGADGPLLDRIREAISQRGSIRSNDAVARTSAPTTSPTRSPRGSGSTVNGRSAAVPARAVHDRCLRGCASRRAGRFREGRARTRSQGARRAHCYAERYLADRGRLRGIDAEASDSLARFDELADGALVDDRV